jgi:DNA adenine methylase
LQSIFRWPGGKSRRTIRDLILSHRPAGVEEYREPFVGGGGVFFAAADFRRRWINDLNVGLVAVYLALRDRPEAFIDRCWAVKPADLKAAFARVVADDKEDSAYRFFLANRCVYGGMVNFTLPCRTRLGGTP